mmetsp:Transcript_16428/g.53669  ORF Transcript_16428/g.53669 Transcript_16428/m.53669 type:complete len:80 (+) Transcript_16428:368-607(+)
MFALSADKPGSVLRGTCQPQPPLTATEASIIATSSSDFAFKDAGACKCSFHYNTVTAGEREELVEAYERGEPPDVPGLA